MLRIDSFTGTEVGKLYLVIQKENVLRLDIAMENASFVHVI
jgi:hypothetical protein